MTLADLRRLSIRKQLRISFVLTNGMDCVVTEHGLAKVPALSGPTNLNLEQELAQASRFRLEYVGRANAESLTRETLESMTVGSRGTAAAPEHDEE
jgi:hypothetical protein